MDRKQVGDFDPQVCASLGQPAQVGDAVNAYQRAVDEGLIIAHLGTAEDDDDRETATRKLGQLLDWHVAVAIDPAVNGGFKLVPSEQPEGEGDWYTDEQGCHHFDLDDDPKRQLSIMLKPNGEVVFAVYVDGKRFHGNATAPIFCEALAALTGQPDVGRLVDALPRYRLDRVEDGSYVGFALNVDPAGLLCKYRDIKAVQFNIELAAHKGEEG